MTVVTKPTSVVVFAQYAEYAGVVVDGYEVVVMKRTQRWMVLKKKNKLIVC